MAIIGALVAVASAIVKKGTSDLKAIRSDYKEAQVYLNELKAGKVDLTANVLTQPTIPDTTNQRIALNTLNDGKGDYSIYILIAAVGFILLHLLKKK